MPHPAPRRIANSCMVQHRLTVIAEASLACPGANIDAHLCFFRRYFATWLPRHFIASRLRLSFTHTSAPTPDPLAWPSHRHVAQTRLSWAFPSKHPRASWYTSPVWSPHQSRR